MLEKNSLKEEFKFQVHQLHDYFVSKVIKNALNDLKLVNQFEKPSVKL